MYGVIQSGDHRGRTCVIKWIKLNPSVDDVEVRLVTCADAAVASAAPSSALPLRLQVIGVEEDVSVYDIADHPDFHFRTTDIVIRIWNSDNAENECDNEVGRSERRSLG